MKTETETYYHYSSRKGNRILDKKIKIVKGDKGKKGNKYKGDKEIKEITYRTILVIMLSITSSILFYHSIKAAIYQDAYITLFFNIWMLILFVILSVLLSVRLFRGLFRGCMRGYKKGEKRERENKGEKIWPSPPYSEAPGRNAVKRKQISKQKYAEGGIVPKDYLAKQHELYNETYKDFILDPKTTIKRPGTTFKQSQIVENLNDY